MERKKAKIFVWKSGRFVQLNDIVIRLANRFYDLNSGSGIVSGNILYQLIRKRKGPVIPLATTKTFDFSFDDTFK